MLDFTAVPSTNRRNCLICRQHDSVVGPISSRGKCRACAVARIEENMDGLIGKSGPALRRWRVGMAASVGGRLLDELPADSDTDEHAG